MAVSKLADIPKEIVI